MVQIGYPRKGSLKVRPSWIAHFNERVRASNPLVEVLVSYGMVFAIGWLWIPAAALVGSTPWYVAGWAALGVIFTWMIVFSHAIRGRDVANLGFSSHKAFRAKIDKVLRWGDKWNYMLIGGTVVAGYIIFMVTFLPFMDLLPIMGDLNRYLVLSGVHPVIILIIVTGEFIAFAIGTALYFFKTDNIKGSIKEHAKYGTPFVLFLFTWALLTSEEAYTEPFMNVASHFLGYIYWALAQQLTTLVYVAPSAMEGLERAGLVRDLKRRRVVASVITAGIFAGIHLPAMPLTLLTFVMEFIIAMIYTSDEHRNVFTACLLHAMVGVVALLLLRIDATVGYLAVFK